MRMVIDKKEQTILNEQVQNLDEVTDTIIKFGILIILATILIILFFNIGTTYMQQKEMNFIHFIKVFKS